MERLHGTIEDRGFQALLVKPALSFGTILWMFVVATLSHAWAAGRHGQALRPTAPVPKGPGSRHVAGVGAPTSR